MHPRTNDLLAYLCCQMQTYRAEYRTRLASNDDLSRGHSRAVVLDLDRKMVYVFPRYEIDGGKIEYLFERQDIMSKSKENDAVETIILYNANKIKGSKLYAIYIKSDLKEHGIISSKDSKETVNDFVEVFKMGAVDAMIYDVGSACALGFAKNTPEVDDWTSRKKRQEMLKKIFPERTGKKLTS